MGTIIGDFFRDNYRDPFPHSLLSTRERKPQNALFNTAMPHSKSIGISETI